MGREMKRVPMDFDWPLGRVWKGFLNPYRGCDCPWCYEEEGRASLGFTKEYREYKKKWYGFMLGGHYLPNPYYEGRQYCPEAKPYKLEEWEYNFIVGNERLRRDAFGCFDAEGKVPAFKDCCDFFLKHDTFDIEGVFIHTMCEEYCRRNGFDSTCRHCGGSGKVWQTEDIKHLYEKWEPIEPPTGEGYQLWSTTSEGSPKSPVFATFDKLCEWCAENATTFAWHKATKEEWAKMLDHGFVYHQEGNVIMM